MGESALQATTSGPRHAILDLAPLELECMNALWPMGESTVREIQMRLAVSRPRAYTTIMTIMDRLAQKGIVTRRKVGRAYRYQPNLSIDEARVKAVEKILAGFFEGSAEALAAQVAAIDRDSSASVANPARVERRSHEPMREHVGNSAAAHVDGGNAHGTESASQELDETLL